MDKDTQTDSLVKFWDALGSMLDAGVPFVRSLRSGTVTLAV